MHTRKTSWAVTCDFDGTISRFDATDALLQQHATEDWRDAEERWARGEIGSRECLARQVGCLTASLEQLKAFALSVEIDPHFPRFVRFCQAKRVPLCIVSDGIEQIIRSVLARHGLAGLAVHANRLMARRGGGYALGFPNGAAGCGSGTCKCLMLEQVRGPLPDSRGVSRGVLFFGDGRSDYCAATAAADVVAAKAPLLDHMRRRGRPVVEFTSFAEAPAILAGLLREQTQTLSRTEDGLHEPAQQHP